MTKSDLWDIDSIKISVEDTKSATISYKRVASYRSCDIEVKLNLIDLLMGIKITKKVMNEVKSLTVRLEKENNEINELMKWEEDFKNKR